MTLRATARAVARSCRSGAKLPVRAALAWPALRKRAIFELRHGYHHELDCTVPLGHGLVCPIYHVEAWASLKYIFFEHEYTRAFTAMPLPTRWLDVGCYTGFFSLFVVWSRAQAGLAPPVEALLIDGDSRSGAAVKRLASLNGLADQFRFVHGVISAYPGEAAFVERAFQKSAVAVGESSDGVVRRVPTIGADRILTLLAPPYDVVKVDIEGAEFDFLMAYREVLHQTKYLLLEWHGWHPGGGGEDQLRKVADERGFDFICHVLRPNEAAHRRDGMSGVHLYRNRSYSGDEARFR